MTAKKVLIPKKIYTCDECPNNLIMMVSIDNIPKMRFLCKLTGIGSDYEIIPKECPLEDWEENK